LVILSFLNENKSETENDRCIYVICVIRLPAHQESLRHTKN